MNLSKNMLLISIPALLLALCACQSTPPPSPQGGDGGSDVKDHITVSFAEPKAINPDIFGYNTQSIKGPGWDKTNFIDKITELNPSNFRYPGGTVGNFWDWRTGYYNKIGQSVNVISTSTVYPYKIDNVKTVYDKTGAAPIYMLNMLTSSCSDQIAMLKYAESIGLPVKYIEMGNEYYLDDHPEKYNYLTVYPEIGDYADSCRVWTQKLHTEFPDAQIGIIGVTTPASWTKRERARTWNATMMKDMEGIFADAYTIHIYPKINYKGTPYDMLSQSLKGVAEDKVLDASIDSKYKLWVTEYNFESGSNPYAGQWVHGLSAILMSAELIATPRVELICFFNLTAGKPASAIYDSSYDIAGSTASKFALSASGEGLKMLAKAQKQATSVRRMIFSKNPTVATTKDGAMRSLYGYLFCKGGRDSIIIINIGIDPQTISISDLPFTPTTLEHVFAADIETPVCGPSSLTRQTKAVSGSSITVRPYSITILH